MQLLDLYDKVGIGIFPERDKAVKISANLPYIPRDKRNLRASCRDAAGRGRAGTGGRAGRKIFLNHLTIPTTKQKSWRPRRGSNP